MGTIVSRLQSDRLTKKFGTGNVTAASVLMTATAPWIDSKNRCRVCKPVFIGIRAGRAFSGFLKMKLNDTQMIRRGQGLMLAGIMLLFLSFGSISALRGLGFIGVGCAPVYLLAILALMVAMYEKMLLNLDSRS